MYRCNECLEIFEEPIIHETSYEYFYGVASEFPNSTYLRLELCPVCGSECLEEVESEEE